MHVIFYWKSIGLKKNELKVLWCMSKCSVYFNVIFHRLLFLFKDLMLPGIIQTEDQNLEKEKEFQKDEVCSVALFGNR